MSVNVNTCTKVNESKNDILFHILYSSDHQLLLQLCYESAQRLDLISKTTAAMELFELSKHSHHMAVCVFFMMLNADITLKEMICKEFVHPVAKVKFQPLCGYKAPIFLKNLNKFIIPDFLRNECKNSIQLEEDIRIMYQCS